jgi:hypothetical protein
MGPRYPFLSWAFELNPSLYDLLLSAHQTAPAYLRLLDGLARTLRQRNVKGVQMKILDIGPNNLSKMRSTVSELRVAELLALNGKDIELLPDDYLLGKSPDILARDSLGEHYVEVARFSDDEIIEHMLGKVTEILERITAAYRVDIFLSSDLSKPAVEHQERRKKEGIAESVLAKFGEVLAGYEDFSATKGISVEGVEFQISKSPIEKGFVGTVSIKEMVLQSGQFSDRIRFLVSDPKYGKAIKRESWKGTDRSKYYIIAIVVEQPFFDIESAITPLLGFRNHYTFKAPKVDIHPLVKEASTRGWTPFLEEVHLIPRGETIFTSYGAFLEDAICNNVSAVLVLAENRSVWLPNPFASGEINNPRLVRFWNNRRGGGS